MSTLRKLVDDAAWVDVDATISQDGPDVDITTTAPNASVFNYTFAESGLFIFQCQVAIDFGTLLNATGGTLTFDIQSDINGAAPGSIWNEERDTTARVAKRLQTFVTDPIYIKSGLIVDLRMLSTNVGDTSIQGVINIIDAMAVNAVQVGSNTPESLDDVVSSPTQGSVNDLVRGSIHR